jgi:hypothetical protein
MNLALALPGATMLLKRASAFSSEITFSTEVIDGLVLACWLGLGFFIPMGPYALNFLK